MSKKETVLSPSQHKFLLALLELGHISAASRVAGINRATAYRWMHDDKFISALAAAQEEGVSAMSRRMMAIADTALSALDRVLTDPNTPPGVIVAGADKVLGNMIAFREQVEILPKLADLERYVGQNR